MVLTFNVHQKHHATLENHLRSMPHVQLHSDSQAGIITPPDADGLKFAYAIGPRQDQITVMVIENPNCVSAQEIKDRIEADVKQLTSTN